MANTPDGPDYESVIDDLADKLESWRAQESESAEAFARRIAPSMAQGNGRRGGDSPAPQNEAAPCAGTADAARPRPGRERLPQSRRCVCSIACRTTRSA